MAADLEDRWRLAANQAFVDRVTAATWSTANAVGLESQGTNIPRSEKRTDLIRAVLADPERYGVIFARACAGWNPTAPAVDIADTFADTVGTDDVKVAAITDTRIEAYVAGAWDVVAGVDSWERGG